MSVIIQACICMVALCLIYRLTESSVYATVAAALMFILMAI